MDKREPVSRRLLFALLAIPFLLIVAGMVAWDALCRWVTPAYDESDL